jgi:hypothetical protein
MSCWSNLLRAAAFALLTGALFSGAAGARDFKIGCAGGACVIVDDTGRITYFRVGDKALADGADQLRSPSIGRIRPPLNISCSAAAGGDRCVVTDADGYVWVGSTRPGSPFGAPVAKVMVPGER